MQRPTTHNADITYVSAECQRTHYIANPSRRLCQSLPSAEQAQGVMPNEKYCFVQTSPFGQSKEARKIEQLRARAHAASISPRRKRTSFKVLHDVLGLPAQATDIPTTTCRRPASPPSPAGESPVKIKPAVSASLPSASSSIAPLSPPDTPDEFKEEDRRLNKDLEAPGEKKDTDQCQNPTTGALVIPNHAADLIPSDYRCFRGMRTDPFNCIPARGSDSVSNVVDYREFPKAPTPVTFGQVLSHL